MTPDRAPNLHPLVVHFPIALLAAAALVDVVSLGLRRRYPTVRHAAVGLYALGAVGALGTYLSGRSGIGVRAVTPENPTRDDHTGHGTRAGDHMSGDSATAGMDHDMAGMAPGASEVGDAAPGATWEWTPGDGALPAGTRFVEGDMAALAATRTRGALVARPTRPVLFVAGAPAVEVEATLDLSQFTGMVMLVHHVRSPQDYDFLAVDKPTSGLPTVRQGRVAGGQTTVFADRTIQLAEPVQLTAVAAGSHFRGLVAGALATHGHGDAAEPGAVGLRIAGTGPVGIRRLAATAVE